MNNNSIDLVGLELTKSNIEVLASNIINQVNEGFQDAIELDCRLKFVEETLKKAREKLKKQVLLAGINRQEINGVKTSFRNGYAILDYETDSTYEVLKNKLSERKDHLDLAFKSKDEIVINGEIIPKIAVKNYTADSISYTFSK
jgi:hypothetical protein